MIVQHVNVQSGAQAVIGNVSARGRKGRGGGEVNENPNPMKRCGAYARTTGKLYERWGMANGRCRLHGGLSTGRPITHGRRTKPAMAERRRIRELLRVMRELLGGARLERQMEHPE